MWFGAHPGAEFNDGVFIYKDPWQITGANIKEKLAFSGGMRGLELDPECGYLPMARVELLEESEESVKFRLTADLFNPLATAAGENECERLDQKFVERVEFEVSLPYGPIHSGGSEIKRGHPPGQEVYDDEEFPPGPFFGGILTSISLRDEGFPEPGEAGTGSEPGFGPSLGGNGGLGGAGGVFSFDSCDCACPAIDAVPILTCAQQCRREWLSCPPSAASILGRLFAESEPVPEPPTPTNEAQRKYLDRLIGDSGLPDQVREMLIDDSSEMSDETRRYLLRQYRDGAY